MASTQNGAKGPRIAYRPGRTASSIDWWRSFLVDVEVDENRTLQNVYVRANFFKSIFEDLRIALRIFADHILGGVLHGVSAENGAIEPRFPHRPFLAG